MHAGPPGASGSSRAIGTVSRARIPSGHVRRRLLDEPGPAADRAEGVDDPVVLGEVAGVRAVDGHAADRVEQHDVVDDRFERRSSRAMPPATVAGPGEATKSARPRRTWTSSARIESATSSAVSAPRSRPAGARSAASRSSATVVSSRSHVADDAGPGRRGDEPDVRRRRGSATAPTASSSQIPWRRDDDVRRGVGVEAADVGRGDDPIGAREGVGLGDRVDDGDTASPAAEPRRASAPAIGVVPMTQRTGAADAVPRRSPACHRNGRS